MAKYLLWHILTRLIVRRYSNRSPYEAYSRTRASGSCNVQHPTILTTWGHLPKLIFFIVEISLRKSTFSSGPASSIVWFESVINTETMHFRCMTSMLTNFLCVWYTLIHDCAIIHLQVLKPRTELLFKSFTATDLVPIYVPTPGVVMAPMSFPKNTSPKFPEPSCLSIIIWSGEISHWSTGRLSTGTVSRAFPFPPTYHSFSVSCGYVLY